MRQFCGRRMPDQRGFTLIELMLAVAVMGLLIAVAVPSFLHYQERAKVVECEEQIRRIYKGVTDYWRTVHTIADGTTTSAILPPAAGPTPEEVPRGRTAYTSGETWRQIPGWKAIDFFVIEPSYFSYAYLPNPPDSFVVSAMCDLDGDEAEAVWTKRAQLDPDAKEWIGRGTYRVTGLYVY